MTLAECFFLAIWEALKLMFQPAILIPAVLIASVLGVLMYFQQKKEMENEGRADGRSVQEGN